MPCTLGHLPRQDSPILTHQPLLISSAVHPPLPHHAHHTWRSRPFQSGFCLCLKYPLSLCSSPANSYSPLKTQQEYLLCPHPWHLLCPQCIPHYNYWLSVPILYSFLQARGHLFLHLFIFCLAQIVNVCCASSGPSFVISKPQKLKVHV